MKKEKVGGKSEPKYGTSQEKKNGEQTRLRGVPHPESKPFRVVGGGVWLGGFVGGFGGGGGGWEACGGGVWMCGGCGWCLGVMCGVGVWEFSESRSNEKRRSEKGKREKKKTLCSKKEGGSCKASNAFAARHEKISRRRIQCSSADLGGGGQKVRGSTQIGTGERIAGPKNCLEKKDGGWECGRGPQYNAVGGWGSYKGGKGPLGNLQTVLRLRLSFEGGTVRGRKE